MFHSRCWYDELLFVYSFNNHNMQTLSSWVIINLVLLRGYNLYLHVSTTVDGIMCRNECTINMFLSCSIQKQIQRVNWLALFFLDWSATGNILARFPTVCAEFTWSARSWLRPLSVSPRLRSVGVPTSFFGLFSCSTLSVERLGWVMGFCRFIDGKSHRFSPNVLGEDLADRLIQI